MLGGVPAFPDASFSFPQKPAVNTDKRRRFFFASTNKGASSFTLSTLRVVPSFVPALERPGTKTWAGFGELDYG